MYLYWLTCGSFWGWCWGLPSPSLQPQWSVCIALGWKSSYFKHFYHMQTTRSAYLEKISSEDLSWWAPPRKWFERESARLPEGFQVAISSRWGPGVMVDGMVFWYDWLVRPWCNVKSSTLVSSWISRHSVVFWYDWLVRPCFNLDPQHWSIAWIGYLDTVSCFDMIYYRYF